MKRLESLDILRGFDMFFIMGLPALVTAISVLVGLGGNWWLTDQLKHVDWHGWHLMDGVFPTFLFISGVSWPYSLASRRAKGATNGAIVLNILRRVLILFILGLLCEGITHIDLGWQAFRFGSVLGRIGFAWGGAALLYVFCSRRIRLAAAATILIGYWMLLLFVPAPDAATIAIPAGHAYSLDRGPFSLVGCLEGWVDRTVLPGRISRVVLDTQGLLSILPAICLPLFGGFAGEFVRRDDIANRRKPLVMLAAAAVLALTGWTIAHWCGSWSMPFNRSIWTSSHILWSGGYALSLFAVFYWIVDVKGWRRWAFFFKVIGMNAIAIWMLTRLYGIGGYKKFDPLRDATTWLFGGVAKLCPPEWGALIIAAGYIAIAWGVLYFLYRHKIFIKV